MALAAVLLSSCGQDQRLGATVPNAQGGTSPSAAASEEAQPTQAQTGTSEAAEPATSARPTGSKPAPKPAGSERCHTSMLSGSVQPSDSGAGQRYAELVLTNTSGETCNIYGYGGMQLIGADGSPLPTKVERTPNPGPALVRLAPGGSASATLHWSVIPHEGEPETGQCEPTPVRLDVIPPDETDALSATWDLGAVCGFGTISGSAYHS
ncbi:DUF4232 domain-containing protein [Saccharopolyspora taberi]|uniref:DUF4232 domain-containing protein n=1 Tax=Saccharopolyspora taberi TaxID=60895 RepID=A0ABN3V8J4_9PSEU